MEQKENVMKKFNGGSQVKGGYYWNTAKWEVVPVKEEMGALPGGPGETYVKVSVPMLLVLAPALGGAYALFLPFIGFAMATYAVGRKIGLIGAKAIDEAAATMTPAWRPGEAHLVGQAEAKDGEEAAKSEALEALESEVASKKDDAGKN
jgi:hypothetical protein